MKINQKEYIIGIMLIVGVGTLLLLRHLSHSESFAAAVGGTAFNTGGLTVNSNGISDTLTVTTDRGAGSELWVLGLGPVTLSLSGATGKFITDDGFAFAIPVTTGTAYKREIIYTGGNVVYKINGQSHSRPAAAPNLAPISARSGVQGSPVRYGVSVSNFCHTKNAGATCHLYDGTPDTTKRATSGTPPVNLVTTQKGAGYTG